MRWMVACAVLYLACTPIPSPAPVRPDAADAAPPVGDAAPIDGDASPRLDACDWAYRHLVGIGCTPKGPTIGTWVEVCRNDRQHGAFQLRGINNAMSVAEARQAGVDCQP